MDAVAPLVELGRGASPRLHLVRHGETQANREMLFPGREARLTGSGVAQARKAGQEFAKKGVLLDTILVSPTRRTFDTMKLALEEMEGCGLVLPAKTRIVIVAGFLEKDPGEAVGRKIPGGAGEIDSLMRKTNGETYPLFIERVENAAAKIIREIESGLLGNNVVVFGHSLVNRVILGVCQGIGGARGLDGPSQINGGIKTVGIERSY
ncbi:MAG: phosphoglycerate mutase family protein [Candidatus Micrarchaeota archaeon]